jgi:hypothetical protein
MVATTTRKAIPRHPSTTLALTMTTLAGMSSQAKPAHDLDEGPDRAETSSRQSFAGLEVAATPVEIDESRYVVHHSIVHTLKHMREHGGLIFCQ